MILTRVDLPAPLSPTNAWISPAYTLKSTSSNARSGPKDLLTIFNLSNGSRPSGIWNSWGIGAVFMPIVSLRWPGLHLALSRDRTAAEFGHYYSDRLWLCRQSPFHHFDQHRFKQGLTCAFLRRDALH